MLEPERSLRIYVSLISHGFKLVERREEEPGDQSRKSPEYEGVMGEEVIQEWGGSFENPRSAAPLWTLPTRWLTYETVGFIVTFSYVCIVCFPCIFLKIYLLCIQCSVCMMYPCRPEEGTRSHYKWL